MEEQIISLPEVLKIIQLKDRNGAAFPFDIKYRTFNSQTKQGGNLKEYKGVKHIPNANPHKELETNAFNILETVKKKKKPNHFKNRTRNIELLNGTVRTVRIDFIISINNKKVIY